jgi:hypothetical protein
VRESALWTLDRVAGVYDTAGFESSATEHDRPCISSPDP